MRGCGMVHGRRDCAGPQAVSGPATTDNEWITKIGRWQKTHAMTKWENSCKKIRALYRYEDSTSAKTRKYQLLWSNMETMKGATYAKPPKADVSRRFLDKDATARQATLMVERCIDYTFDANDYDGVFKQVRDDFLLDARGQARVVYEPVMEAVALPDDGLDGADVEGAPAEAEDIEGEAKAAGDDASEILTFEHVKIKYLHRDDFAHEPARTWEEVKRLAFRSFLDRDELVKRFPRKLENGQVLGEAITLDAKGDEGDKRDNSDNDGEIEPKATIWELWDKVANKVSWYAVGYPDVLDEGKPYLKFENFFPCPKPAYGTLTNDTLAPRPDYVFYQDQAEEINMLTARISSLTDSLKIVGFYPGGPKGEGTPEVERAVTPGVENKMIAVQGWDNFTTKGGGKVPVIFLPITEVVQVLEGCVKLRQQLIDDVNQIYGLSDIMRGDGDAGETATAQRVKAQYGSLRIRTRQAELARFCRDITRLVGEVVCNHFQPETIMAMSNLPLPTDADVLAQIQAQQQQQAMQQAMAQHAAAMQQQQSANGGPPMNGTAPAPQPQPGSPMGMHA